jgi:hypothetical protein
MAVLFVAVIVRENHTRGHPSWATLCS